VNRLGERTVVAVSGELDVATAAELEKELVDAEAEADTSRLIVDLTATTFLDSTGLKVVARVARRAAHQVTLVCPPSNRAVMRVLGFAGMGDALRLVDTLDDAGRG
jgi:anti-sigma B factor antagonist